MVSRKRKDGERSAVARHNSVDEASRHATTYLNTATRAAACLRALRRQTEAAAVGEQADCLLPALALFMAD